MLRYLEQLSTKYEIYLVSYEKQEDWRDNEKREALTAHMAEVGIKWLPLRYHKSPTGLATAFDILHGIFIGCWVVIRCRIQIVHARSYVPSVIAMVLKKLFGLKYIFDMRGFWADERVDGGIWPKHSRMYRMAKWFEKRFLLSADHVVSLTHAAVEEMKTFSYLHDKFPKFEVIPTCADLNLFKPGSKKPIKEIEYHSFTLGYVGSVGVWYLFDETLHCFQLLRQRIPNARFHILNRGGHEYILECIAAHNIEPNSIIIESADHSGVVRAMQNMDAGIFFYKPTYSRIATSPTRLGEFLGCGVPCLGNIGVGDMATILEGKKVGISLNSFDDAAMNAAIDQLLILTQQDDIKAKCRETALQHFSLVDGVRAYDEIYTSLSDEFDG